MNKVERKIVDVPVDQVTGIEELFGRMMKLDVQNIPLKFKKAFEKTKTSSFQSFKMRSIFESYQVKSIQEDAIELESGIVFQSKLMADMFRNSFELAFVVVTLDGYDEADKAEDNMLYKLFLDSWGTAFVERGSNWVGQYIAMALEKEELYVTNSFSPGQNDIPMEFQEHIFSNLKPEEIGVTLGKKYMMHPKKSISGIFGIQTQRNENRIRPCDLCERRETCPTAYA